MRYINIFCGRYSLATGTRAIAWFYIVLYLVNVILNIFSVDIVKSYEENVDEDIDYDKNNLLTLHYICLTFGVVTILLSAAFLVKMSESEDFMQFMVKWNVVRCLFVFIAIIYTTVEMDHILTVSISLILPTVDLCASTYFTGVMASYIKELEDPNGQVYSSHKSQEASVYLVSHKKKTLETENKVSYVNEVSTSSAQSAGHTKTNVLTGIVNIAAEENDTTEVNDSTKSISNGVTSTEVDEDDTSQGLNTSQLPVGEVIPKDENTFTEKSTSNCAHQKDDTELQNMTSLDPEIHSETMNPNETDEKSDNDTRYLINNESTKSDANASKETEDITVGVDTQMEDEKQEMQDPGNDVEIQENTHKFSEKCSEEKGIENPAVDVTETEPPSVVIVPSSPEVEINLDIEKHEDTNDPETEQQPSEKI